MTRVHTVARAGRRERPTSARTDRRKPAFKIVKEVVTQEKKKFRTVASYNAEPPQGYSFIPVGYPDLTELCKKKCQGQNLQFQTVNAKPKNKANLDPDKVSHHIHRVGNHFPTDIVQRACQQLGYWINPAKPGEYKKYNVRLEGRLARHKHKDEREKIRSAIQELFPNLPPKDLKDILHHAFRKGSMRVGNADMPLIRRVQLAVSAHARHNYTDYDSLLKKISWGEARQLAEQPTLNQLKAWRGEDFDNHETEQVLRETIIIDSESDDDSDDDSSDDSLDSASRSVNRDVSLEFVSQNTYGDDRGADIIRDNDVRYQDAYIASSRRQAQYQALNAPHGQDLPQSARPPFSRSHPPPLVSIHAPYATLPRAEPHRHTEYHQYPLAASREHIAPPVHHVPPPPIERDQPYPHVHERFDRHPVLIPIRSEYGSHHGVARDSNTAPYPAYARSYDRGTIRALPSSVQSYEPAYDRRVISSSQRYDLVPQHISRQATPEHVVPSIEPRSPAWDYKPSSHTPHSGVRLATDHNGRTILVNLPAERDWGQDMPYPVSAAPHFHTDLLKRRSREGYAQEDRVAPDTKRPRVSPPDARPMPWPNVGTIDLTEDSPTRHSHHRNPPAPIAQHSFGRSDPHYGLQTQLKTVPNQDLDYSPRAPTWLDSATNQFDHRHDYPHASSRAPEPGQVPYDRPPVGQLAREPPRLVPIERVERREQPDSIPQPSHPDDSMRSLYDEREPQPPRKPHNKKHHASRSRYYDHDSSAARQQEQPLDYL